MDYLSFLQTLRLFRRVVTLLSNRKLALVTLASIGLSVFTSDLALVKSALFELCGSALFDLIGFASNLALVTLKLFGPSLLLQLFALRCHFSVCCLHRFHPCAVLSLWCLLLAHSHCMISLGHLRLVMPPLLKNSHPCTMAWLPFSLLWLSCASATFRVAAIPIGH